MSNTHPILFETRDGQQLRFECGEEESLLAAARRQRLAPPALCQQGSCGVCQGQWREGEFLLAEHEEAALSEEARSRGRLLLCRTFPRSAMTLALDQPAAALAEAAHPPRRARITAVESVGGGVMRLELALETGEGIDASATFEAGQYMELTPLSPERADFTRAYSLANTSNWEGRLEFLIRLQPEGRFSSWLSSAKEGDSLEVKGPSGGFLLDEAALGPRWFVAGGSGLAPLLSMLRWSAEMGSMQPLRLYFGVNREEELFAQPQLEELKALLPSLKITTCVAEGDGGETQRFVGNPIQALEPDLSEALAAGKQPSLYLCGPPGLIEAGEALALRLGLPERQIHSERFLPA